MTEDVKALWRGQPADANDPRLERLRARAEAQRARLRRARILLVACALLGAGLGAKLAMGAPTALLRFGEGLLSAGFLLLLVLGWRRLSRVPPDTAEACVDFLRESLARRRRAARGGWIGVIAPLLPGLVVMLVGLMIASDGRWLRLAPIAGPLGVWFVILLVMQAKEAAKVAAEMAALDRLVGGAVRTVPTPPSAAP